MGHLSSLEQTSTTGQPTGETDGRVTDVQDELRVAAAQGLNRGKVAGREGHQAVEKRISP